MIRVGLIGAGRHGSRYAAHILRDMEGMTLAAMARRSEQGQDQARDWGCRWFRDWRDLVADPGVDAVIGVVPPAHNPAIAAACSAAGKPLLLEKPMAADLAGAREILALWQQGKLRLTVGQTLRYNQVIRLFARQLPERGRLYSFTANQRLEPSTLAWHEDPSQAGAGVSFHTAVHVFDALRFITGREIRRVMARTGQHHNGSLEDLLVAMVEMESGILGLVDCSKISPARSGRFEFVTDQGQLAGDQVHSVCHWISGRTVTPLDPGPPVPTIRLLLADWQRYLGDEGDNPVPPPDGFAAVAACAACLASARDNTWQQPVSPVNPE